METITNAASTVTSTVSNLIYGAPAKETETAHNETAGKEPLSGEQGKGTANEPFDKGNAVDPVDTTSTTNTVSDSTTGTSSTAGTTSYKQDDFLKLNPTLGEPTTTDSTSSLKTGTTSETGMPIIPLNPNVATNESSHTTSSAGTGMTDKTGVTDKVWKETALDEIKPSGAPGAGPSAPEYKAATPDTSLTSSASDNPSGLGAATTSLDSSALKKETVGSDITHDSSVAKKEGEASHLSSHAQPPVGGPIDDVLNKGTTASPKHTVDDAAVEDPHSKMAGHHAESIKHADVSTVKSHPAEASSHHSESSKAPAHATPASPTEHDEKTGKMSRLTGKLKDKLHIGSKDK